MNNELGPVFYVNRADGFGARLNAVVNAIAMANYFDGKFAFSWEEKIRDGILHSVQSKNSVFSAKFNEKYSSRSGAIGAGKLPVGLKKYIELAPDARRNLFQNKKIVIDVESNLPDCWLDLVGEEKSRDILKSSFSKIELNPGLSDVVGRANAVDTGTSTVALHLRAGDVVYAGAKYTRSIGKKAIPYQLAWQYLDDCRSEGSKVILFGQDMQLCRALARGGDAVLCEDLLDTGWNAFQRELFEITLISRCSVAVGGESSFLRLAAAAAGKTPKTIYEIYPTAERQRIILADDVPDAVRAAASDGQKLYSLWMVAADMFEDDATDISQLLSITARALSHQPADAFMRLCHACALAGSGRFDEGEILIADTAGGDVDRPILRRVKPEMAIRKRLIALLSGAVAENLPWASALQVLIAADKIKDMSAVARTALNDQAVSASPWARLLLDLTDLKMRETAPEASDAAASTSMIEESADDDLASGTEQRDEARMAAERSSRPDSNDISTAPHDAV